MDRLRGLGAQVVRFRYVVLLVVAGVAFTHFYAEGLGNHPQGDWLFFKTGAFTLQHYDRTFDTPRLHLYADLPGIQIGPPALMLVALLQTVFPVWLATLASSLLMLLAGPFSVWCIETAAGRARPDSAARLPLLALIGGMPVAVAFAENAGVWRHLDDVMALTAAALTLLLVMQGRAWWLAALLLGTGIAAKPWAIGFVPLAWVAAAGRDRVLCVLATLAAAALWWLPFELAAPQTAGALSGKGLFPDQYSVLWSLGIHANQAGWLRPIQFIAAIGVGAVLAARRPVMLAPGGVVAVLILIDPYAWPYYGLGPILTSLAVDFARRRTLPWAALGAAAVLYGAPQVLHPGSAGLVRLVWGLALLAEVGLPEGLGSKARLLSRRGSPQHASDLAQQIGDEIRPFGLKDMVCASDASGVTGHPGR